MYDVLDAILDKYRCFQDAGVDMIYLFFTFLPCRRM